MRKKVIETTEMLNKQMGDALIDLLKVKPLSKITIEELTLKADVGRATFFRHFKSKEDLLTYRLLLLYSEYMGADPHNSQNDIRNSVKFFDYYRDTRELHDLLIQNELEGVMFDAYKKLFIPSEENISRFDLYKAHYMAYGLFGVVTKWLKNGCVDSSEDMASLCIQLLS